MTLRGPGDDGWRKSSRCESHNCVEVAIGRDGAGVRDTASPQIQLSFSPAAWRQFIGSVQAGELAKASK